MLKPSFSNTQMKKLRALERRSKSLINNFDPNILNLLKKRVCFSAYDVINEKICSPLNNFYKLKVSKINTTNDGYMVKLPNTKFEYDCSSLNLWERKFLIAFLWKLENNASIKVLS